jgi:hypothetical protein
MATTALHQRISKLTKKKAYLAFWKKFLKRLRSYYEKVRSIWS